MIESEYSENKFLKPLQTPLLRIFDSKRGNDLFLKDETKQYTGAFKYRGVYNKLSRVNLRNYAGVITASTGNHGIAVSFACSQIKEYSVIVIPYNTPQNKIQKICNNGAKIICVETLDTYDKCVDYAVSYAKKNNFLYVPSFDDWDIIDGHKNLFREISSVQTDFSKIYCQIGGGGLISALITTDYFDKKTVCGVELENEDAMRQSMLRNEIVEIPISKGGSFCEGVTVSKIGRIPFSNIVSKNIMIETVSAEDVVNAIRFLFEYGIKAEGAGALGVARYLKSDITQSKVLCIISGGNINDDLFKEMIQG